MSDTNETIADILREMRTYFQTQKRNGKPEHRPWHQVLSDWADRIEAAAKRELSRAAEDAAGKAALDRTARDAAEYMAYAMAHNSATQSGNAAAMLAALEECRDYLYGVLHDAFYDAQVSEQSDNPSMAGCEREQKLYKEVAAALSAPARNCDRYGDEDDAFAAWHDALNDGDVVSVRNAFAWLFAKAEGGAE